MKVSKFFPQEFCEHDGANRMNSDSYMRLIATLLPVVYLKILSFFLKTVLQF